MSFPNRAALIGLPLAVLALTAAPALAAKNAVNIHNTGAKRSIAVKNWTSGTIAQAKVQTTPDGRVWTVGQGSIPKNQGAELVVPARDCIANVRVKLQTGRVLQLAGLHDCHNTEIAVRDHRISIPQVAVPGAQQHGTPG